MDDLKEVLGIDTTCIFLNRTVFGFVNENWKGYRTPWGQKVLVSEHFKPLENGRGTFIFPRGDTSVPPSGHMPKTVYFFDSIFRQEEIDEDHLVLEDNLEEFCLVKPEEEYYWKEKAALLRGAGRAVVPGCWRDLVSNRTRLRLMSFEPPKKQELVPLNSIPPTLFQ